MSDNEIITIWNEHDARNGWFTIGTSLQRQRDRIVRRVGAENVLLERVSRSRRDNKPTWFELTLPIALFARASCGVRKAKRTKLETDSATAIETDQAA
jgi:hypothetical protein